MKRRVAAFSIAVGAALCGLVLAGPVASAAARKLYFLNTMGGLAPVGTSVSYEGAQNLGCQVWADGELVSNASMDDKMTFSTGGVSCGDPNVHWSYVSGRVETMTFRSNLHFTVTADIVMKSFKSVSTETGCLYKWTHLQGTHFPIEGEPRTEFFPEGTGKLEKMRSESGCDATEFMSLDSSIPLPASLKP
jgi:hypothetical protein